MAHNNMQDSKSIKNYYSSNNEKSEFNATLAGEALIDGLDYLKNQLEWSGRKIADILHLPPNTMNTWLKNGNIPISNAKLTPDIQAIIHLLAIHRSLEVMFENPTHQKIWLETFHPQFNTSPITFMSQSIDGLIFVRQYLDFIRGRGA